MNLAENSPAGLPGRLVPELRERLIHRGSPGSTAAVAVQSNPVLPTVCPWKLCSAIPRPPATAVKLIPVCDSRASRSPALTAITIGTRNSNPAARGSQLHSNRYSPV
ncbi:MAG: hypothetical protein FJW20_13440 [Acidimicrobiia bacterium]|nr:hypothetical protein [Acidimicrobiia bacterium]